MSPGGSGDFTYKQNMKLVTTKFKSGGLHEKHEVATWNLGNHLSICFWAKGNQGKPVTQILCIYVISFPVVLRLLMFSNHSCQFTASSDTTFLCFITLSTSVSNFTSGCPRCHLPRCDKVYISFGHLLSFMRTTCPHYFKILFSILA